jgi:hypothetical protein
VGFVADKAALEQVFSCQSLRRLLRAHHHLSSGTVAEGQMVADIPSGLSHTPHKNYTLFAPDTKLLSDDEGYLYCSA